MVCDFVNDILFRYFESNDICKLSMESLGSQEPTGGSLAVRKGYGSSCLPKNSTRLESRKERQRPSEFGEDICWGHTA